MTDLTSFLNTEPKKLRVTAKGLCSHLRRLFEEHDFDPVQLTPEIAECHECKKRWSFHPKEEKFVEVPWSK